MIYKEKTHSYSLYISRTYQQIQKLLTWKTQTCFAFDFMKIMELSLERLQTVLWLTERELIKFVLMLLFLQLKMGRD